MVSLSPSTLIGAKDCASANCGKEAACQPQSDGSILCICPHDLSRMPPDGKCPRIVVQANAIPSSIPYKSLLKPDHVKLIYDQPISTSDKPLESTENINDEYKTTLAWLAPTLILTILILVLLLAAYRRRWRFYGARHNNNNRIGNRDKSNTATMPVALTKTVILQDRFTANPEYWASDSSEGEATALQVQSFVLIQPERIHLIQEIGEGCFGKVYKGQLKSHSDVDEAQLVAVKVLKAGSDGQAREDLLHEAEIMASFQHRNILSLRGIVINDSNVGPWMVFEYMPYGDLAQLLRSANGQFNKVPSPFRFDQSDLHSIALQIADGMAYLSSQHFVHRDLACRNCLVGHQLCVKISDFGMSRDVYTCDYYKIGGSRMLPVRWMAPESIMYGKFTLESDVWSYGVTLWEIYALGLQPYFGHSNEQVLKLILQNVLLTPPSMAPPLIRQLFDGCWKPRPSDRLTFRQICDHLSPKETQSAIDYPITYADIKAEGQSGYQCPSPTIPFVLERPNRDEYLQPLPDISIAIQDYTNSATHFSDCK